MTVPGNLATLKAKVEAISKQSKASQAAGKRISKATVAPHVALLVITSVTSDYATLYINDTVQSIETVQVDTEFHTPRALLKGGTLFFFPDMSKSPAAPRSGDAILIEFSAREAKWPKLLAKLMRVSRWRVHDSQAHVLRLAR